MLRCAGFLQSQRAGAAFRRSTRASRCSVLWSTGSRVCGLQQLKAVGSKVAASSFRCSAACGVFSDQGLNPCPLHWQADSYPLYLQGRSPAMTFYIQTIENSVNLKVLGCFFFFFAIFCLNLSISFGFIYNLRAINTKNLCLVLMFVYVSVTKNNLSQCLKYVKDIFFNLPFKEILSLKIKKCYATLSCFSIYSSHLSQKLFLCCFIITLVLMLWQVTIFDEELNSDS